MSDSVRELENRMKDFDNRYRAKKIVNMICSVFIIFMGVFSVNYIYEFDNDGIMTFRWMTVDGTIYTTILTIIVVACNIYELIRKTEVSRKLSMLELSFGTSFVIVYLIIIVTMIGTGVLTKEYIPYDFLDFENMGGKFAMIGLFVLAYIGAGVLAHFMSVWNRKAYWLWFKNVAKKS